MTGKSFKTWAISIALLGPTALMSLDTQASVSLRTVALTGEPAPGVDAVFLQFRAPFLSETGLVGFAGFLMGPDVTTNNRGIWSAGSASLQFIALEDNPVPGMDVGVVYRTIRQPVIDEAGRIAFFGSIEGPGVDLTNNSGAIWLQGTDSLVNVVRQGNPVSGVSPEVVFGSLIFPPAMNNVGKIAFSASMTGPELLDLEDSGIWVKGAGPLEAVVLEGEAAPGTSPGVVFGGGGQIAFAPPLINSAGQIAFRGALVGPGVDTFNDRGLWVEDAGSFRRVVREGDNAPGFAENIVFGGMLDPPFRDLSFNGNGQVAFAGTLTISGGSSINSIWSEAGGGLHLVTREGSQAPGTEAGGQFLGMIDVKLNNAGQTAFFGELTGPGITDSNDSGLWLESDGSLELVVREGMKAPGTPEGVNFGLLSSPFFLPFNHSILNNVGQIAFEGSLLGQGVDDTNDRGIWATGIDGELLLIVREGDLFDVNDDPLVDDLRTVDLIGLINSVGGRETGSATSFNDAGQLVFRLGFTDGSEGIFVATIPEPGTLAVFTMAGLAMLRRRVSA